MGRFNPSLLAHPQVNAQEKSKLLAGLSAVREDWMVMRWLDVSWNQSVVRSQDYFSALQQTAKHPGYAQME